jgi:hypothetical protein
VRPVDALVNGVRRVIESALLWYDPGERDRIRAETERVRRRSIAARVHVEDVAKRYAQADKALRR